MIFLRPLLSILPKAWNDEIKSSDQGEHHGSPVGLKASKGPSKDAEGQS